LFLFSLSLDWGGKCKKVFSNTATLICFFLKNLRSRKQSRIKSPQLLNLGRQRYAKVEFRQQKIIFFTMKFSPCCKSTS